MNTRQISRNNAIDSIKDFLKQSRPKTKGDKEKLLLFIMRKYKCTRRTAKEYILVAGLEI
jgi:hypothetical protein